VFTRYGLPSQIISDRDPRFASKFTHELCHILGISQNISTAYHPRTDGQSEAKNKWVEQHLRFYVNHYQKNWTYYLPMAEFAHNTWASETTRESPFTLLMGYNPRADWIDRPSPIPQVALRIQQFKEARERAQQSMIKAQKSWVKHKDTPKFQSGDLVWLKEKNLRTVQPTAKLAPKRHGPFKVTQVMSAVNYRLELPTQWSIHPVFHIDLLTPYHETTIHGANYQRPPPDLVEGEEEYEVETVLASRRFGRGKKLQYLVKWKGYPDSDNQWINKEDVFADDAIREFKNSNPDQETHIRRVNVDSPYSHFPPLLLMQNNIATPVTSTTVSDNWTIRDDSIASTSTVSSAPSLSTETTRSQYSFRVEDGGEPSSVELPLPTSMAEESTTAAESPQSVNSEFPITYYVHGQEAPIPFSLTNEAHVIIGSQENQTPITIPPPGNSPALCHIRVTPSSRDSPEVQPLSTRHSIVSETRRVLRQEVPSLKTTSTISSKCSHWLAQLETPDEVPPVRTTPPPVSCPNSIKYGGPVPPHLSFVARGHQLPTISRKTPFRPPPHFLPQFSPLLLDGDNWHPNRMLPSDAAPADSEGKEELGLAWYSLYFQYRDTFRAQLSLCLISRHDLLTRLLHSDSNVTSDVTMSRVLFPSKADDKYLQHTYTW
jgi:hypothetical protein